MEQLGLASMTCGLVVAGWERVCRTPRRLYDGRIKTKKNNIGIDIEIETGNYSIVFHEASRPVMNTQDMKIL